MSWVRQAVGFATMRVNRLANERSPYLLQHAHNPVDWYPWGKEAFEAAKSRQVPIFLSIGYSTCHWCHVMEKESFSDETIASLMNSKFVNIKVDREERPDVDAQYMMYVQMRTGRGGWPLSVFLTTDLEPFMGGTYFPPHDRQGMPGFDTLLLAVSRAWREERERILESSTAVTAALKAYFQGRSLGETSSEPSKQTFSRLVMGAFNYFEETFDEQFGGFGIQPKFPTPPNLHFLFTLYTFLQDGDQASLLGDQQDVNAIRLKCQEMITKTLDQIMRGGIHDHVEGGIHRYAVDRKWTVPHFEKMLYDQAQMINIYAFAGTSFKQTKFLEMARSITEYTEKYLASGDGAYYCATDADSLPSATSTEKEEGAFAIWDEHELREVLERDDAEIFLKCYGNGPVLRLVSSPETVAQEFEISTEACKAVLRKCLEKLAVVRSRRPKPHRDEKILTEWNALMMSAFVGIGDTDKASAIAGYLRRHLYQGNTLLRCTGQRAVSTDYVYLIKSLLDLFSVTLREEHLNWAIELQRKLDEKFKDAASGAYMIAESGTTDVIFPLTEISDGALPSANAVAAENLLRLFLVTGDPEYSMSKDRLLKYASSSIKSSPQSSPFLLSVLLWELYEPPKICLASNLVNNELLRELREQLPLSVITLSDALKPSTIQVCQGNTCHAPFSAAEMSPSDIVSNTRRPGVRP